METGGKICLVLCMKMIAMIPNTYKDLKKINASELLMILISACNVPLVAERLKLNLALFRIKNKAVVVVIAAACHHLHVTLLYLFS